MRRINLSKIVLAFLVLSLILCGCTSTTNGDLKEAFGEHFPEQITDDHFLSEGNIHLYVRSLLKERTSSNPRVVLSLSPHEDDSQKIYDWLTRPISERKQELRSCADMVIEFAKSQGWSNDYYLYVVVSSVYHIEGAIVYDYEKDEIWIPNCEDIFLSMYEQFHTFSKWDIAETEEGREFISRSGLGFTKHNEIEYRIIFYYKAYISEGEFISYGKEYSNSY